MADITIPELGADTVEAKLIRWLKAEGDPVERGEPVAEVETDKVEIELAASHTGFLQKILVHEGETVAVGTAIAVVQVAGEAANKTPPLPAAATNKYIEPVTAAESSRTASVVGVVVEKLAAPNSSRRRVRASPAARKLARDLGVSLESINGTRQDGRIVRKDVELAAKAAVPAVSVAASLESQLPPGIVPLSRMRQVIGRRMAQSKREAPHYYVTAETDMSAARALLHDVNEAIGPGNRITANDLIVRSCAMALQRFPQFNSWFVADQIQRHASINICIGIALEEGLVAPAILDCGAKSLVEISQASRSLAERAKTGAIKPEEYTQGTFTISNVGMFGADSLIAIVQPPQAGILGVGAIRERPGVRDGALNVTHSMNLALSADHRVTDGADGARFLMEIRHLLETPLMMILGQVT